MIAARDLIGVYTTFIMADRSGGVATNRIRGRQVKPLSLKRSSGKTHSKFVKLVKLCSLVFVSST